jgi:hypothetical protein
MPKLKLSNIVERDLYIDSDSFKSLSPKMKDAVKEIFESIKDTKLLYDYFDREIEEQLGE